MLLHALYPFEFRFLLAGSLELALACHLLLLFFFLIKQTLLQKKMQATSITTPLM